jgi:hypothetical protein
MSDWSPEAEELGAKLVEFSPSSERSLLPVPEFLVYQTRDNELEIDGLIDPRNLCDALQAIEEYGDLLFFEARIEDAPLAGEDPAWDSGTHVHHIFAHVELYEEEDEGQ